MKVLIKIWNYPPKGDFLPLQLPIDKKILIKGTFSVMRNGITLSKIKSHCILLIAQRPDIIKNDKTCFVFLFFFVFVFLFF